MIIHVIAAAPGTWGQIFNSGELLALVTNSLIAGAVLGVVGGLISVVVMMRDLAFAVHGIAELSFGGASAALLAGVSVAVGSLMGSIVAALIIGALGVRAADRNSAIGVLMPFGWGWACCSWRCTRGGRPTSSACSPGRSWPWTRRRWPG